MLNRKALATIRRYIGHLFEHVSTFDNAYKLWKHLESLIQKKTPCNKALLVRRLVKLEYKDGQNMIEYLNNFKGLINQLTKAEMKLDDEMQALLLLSSLPESWDTLVVTLSNSAPGGKRTMETVTDSLLNKEARRKERGISMQSEANIIENRGRNEKRGRNNGWGRSMGRSKSRSKLVCYYCGKSGHKKSDWRNFKRDQKAGKVKPDEIEHRREEKSITAVASQDHNEVFLIREENYVNLACDGCSWIVDSGASFHVTPHENYFSSYQNGDFGIVKMGNQVSSNRWSWWYHHDNQHWMQVKLKDVRHVSNMRLNLQLENLIAPAWSTTLVVENGSSQIGAW